MVIVDTELVQAVQTAILVFQEFWGSKLLIATGRGGLPYIKAGGGKIVTVLQELSPGVVRYLQLVRSPNQGA